MLMTEKEALSRWCPMVRVAAMTDEASGVVPGGQSVFNRLQAGKDKMATPTSAACLGSKCAMWRWTNEDGRPNGLGYCGLAGMPPQVLAGTR